MMLGEQDMWEKVNANVWQLIITQCILSFLQVKCIQNNNDSLKI